MQVDKIYKLTINTTTTTDIQTTLYALHHKPCHYLSHILDISIYHIITCMMASDNACSSLFRLSSIIR